MKGAILLLDAEGNQFPFKRATVPLSRCGGLTTKPFCDGTYSKIGFQAAQRAIREEEEQGRESKAYGSEWVEMIPSGVADVYAVRDNHERRKTCL